jgi:hypothetical protein
VQAENRANNLPPLSDAELWENVHDVMGAGHETTASTLTAALYSVAAHPEVDARVAAELAEVLGVGDEVSRARQPIFRKPASNHAQLPPRAYRAGEHLPTRPAGSSHPWGATSCRDASSVLADATNREGVMVGPQTDTRHGRPRTRTCPDCCTASR